jgi:hypothetical protein
VELLREVENTKVQNLQEHGEGTRGAGEQRALSRSLAHLKSKSSITAKAKIVFKLAWPNQSFLRAGTIEDELLVTELDMKDIGNS